MARPRVVCFFFSSRRRHTRWPRDWSSDVCSSDLFGSRFAPRKLYEIHQRAAQVSMSPDLPMQTIWGYDGMTPGPTFIAHYGEPILVRNFNDLPPRAQNDGFGLPSVTTHLHNGHTPSESDGFPCDFFERGQFYDQHYPNVLAGFKDTHPPDGDPNEMMSFLWYHNP